MNEPLPIDDNVLLASISHDRERWFDKDRIHRAVDFDVSKAMASQEEDRVHILNAIANNIGDLLDVPPPDTHPNYDEFDSSFDKL